MLNNFTIHDVKKISKSQVKEGVFIMLLNVTNPPPHLLIIISGKVFSISTKGVELDKPVDVYWQLIHKHQLGCIFVELELPEVFSLNELEEKIRLITKNFPAVDTDTVSCLMPIKSFCSEIYATPSENVFLVFDLLDQLKEKDKIVAYYQLNLDHSLVSGNYEMSKYSIFEVNEAIYKSKGRG